MASALAESGSRTTSAKAGPSIPRTRPSRSAEPRLTLASTTGVAAVTPGRPRSVSPSAQSGTSDWVPGSRRRSAPEAKAAWSAWLRVHVAACAEANVPRAAASISSSAARV